MYVGFIALIILASIHLFANKVKVLGWIWHGRFLSFASGISFAYVFVDLLPQIEKGQNILKPVIPYLDRHAYVIALLGMLFFYGLHAQSQTESKRNFWLLTSGYIFFNLLVGASLSDSTNPEIQPLYLFTIAMGMHYFIRDHNIREEKARWLLVAALFAGYFTGTIIHIPKTVIAIAVSFIAGGVLLNTLHYELPKNEKIGYLFFLIGAILYTAIILNVGSLA